MARRFTRTASEYIIASIGNCGFAFGPTTLAAIIRPEALGNSVTVFQAGAASGARWSIGLGSGGQVRVVRDGSNQNAPSSNVTAGAWWLIAVSKASGSVKPRFHSRLLTSPTWLHEDSGSNLTDGTAPTGQTSFGSDQSLGGTFDGHIAVCGCWNQVLTDTQIESLTSGLMPWFQRNPAGLWLFDQAAVTQKLNDCMNGDADETSKVGTTVSPYSLPWSPGLGAMAA